MLLLADAVLHLLGVRAVEGRLGKEGACRRPVSGTLVRPRGVAQRFATLFASRLSGWSETRP